MRLIRRGQRVFIGSGCGEPQHLVRALEQVAVQLADLEILHLLTLGRTSYTDETFRDKIRLKSLFVASGSRQAIAEGRADYTPIYLFDVPQLFSSGQSPIDVALIQVSPPGAHGFCSFGISVDIVKAAAASAETVIAQVNPRMPRVLGDAYIHVRDIDAIVEHEEELLEMPPPLMNDIAHQIGMHVAKLVEDGSTIRAGVGSVSNAALYSLEGKADLGVHTDMLTDAYLHLVERGVINNNRKTLHPKKIIASFCAGSRRLYDFVHNNPMVEFHPIEYTNDFSVISKNEKMVSINSALEVDLSGQVCADSMGYEIYSGVGGSVDFIRGATLSKEGKSIIVLPSTSLDGKESRIVPHLSEGAGVVNTRGGVHYIVTEHGAVNLHGKTVRERALALINLAHPEARESLLRAAKRLRYLHEDQILPPVTGSVYPYQWEISQPCGDDERVILRPVNPNDEGPLQEFFDALPRHGAYVRFLSVMRVFPRHNLQALLNIDYEKEISVVGVVGSIGAERVVALGRYLLDDETNMAEVDFAVRQEWQGKGVATYLLNHLVEIAKSKHIAGFIAYVDPENKSALAVFQNTGYVVHRSLKKSIHQISIFFNEPAQQCHTDSGIR
ncbi:MAG: GNAT family N-acetyltransferase [Deltaproteobacteria bacterium]|nr:MAG: GNAT family N-acetyltransferase [Deltaproteobacteria bacterium]